jgi:serine/threonine protein phosphatase PrpC
MWTREVRTVSTNNNGIEKRTETIPFLSIARSLGDYWSFVPETGQYAVSPAPDCSVRPIDLNRDKYLILISDGITNVLSSPSIAEHLDDWKTVSNRSRKKSYFFSFAVPSIFFDFYCNFYACWQNSKSMVESTHVQAS